MLHRLELLKELAQHPADAEMVSAATLSMSRVVAGYIDYISEKMVEAYGQEGRDLAAEPQRCSGHPGSATCIWTSGST